MIKRWLSVNRKKSHPEKNTQGNDEINRKATSLKKTKGSGDPSIAKSPSAKSSTSSIPSNLASHERRSKFSSQTDNLAGNKHYHEHYHNMASTSDEREYDSSTTYEDRAFDTESSILFTTITDLMPYGDGSNKVFGYENFGNTCYCNSVLQCLYNIPEFRCNVLRYPERVAAVNRIRKSDLKGSKIRVSTNESFETSTNSGNSNTGYQSNDNEDAHNHHHLQQSDQDNSSSSTQEKQNNFERKRNSFMGFGKGKSNYKDSAKKDDNNEMERPQPVHTVVMASDTLTEKLHEGCKKIIVGRSLLKQSDSLSKASTTDCQANSHCQCDSQGSRITSVDDDVLVNPESCNDAVNNSNNNKENTFPTSEQRKKSRFN